MTLTCDEIRRQLRRTEPPSDAAMEHLARCALCQDVVDLLLESQGGPIGNADPNPCAIPNLLRKTQLQIAQERGILSWLRSRPTPLRLATGTFFVLMPAVAQLAFAPRNDLALYPLPHLLLATGASVVAAAYGTQLLLRPLHRPKSFRITGLTATIAFALPMVLAALAPAYATEATSLHDWHRVSLHQAGVCLRYGALLAAPFVVLLIAMDRQLARGRLFLLLTAGLSGLVGNLALVFHCSNEQPLHQLLGHATVGLLWLALIGIFGRILRR